MDDELSARARQLIDAAMALDVPQPAVVEGSWGMVVARVTSEGTQLSFRGSGPLPPPRRQSHRRDSPFPSLRESAEGDESVRSEPDAGDPALRIPGVGERIAKYVVIEIIGSGAMGVVVRAYDPDLERSVAIKVVRPQAITADRREAARARLVAEARALARISNPNVIAVYEVGLHEGLIYVAMELVSGVDLQQWLRERPRSWRAIVEAYEAAGRGLAAVHAAGLVHRDVKPANILIGSSTRGTTDDARVRIGDLGIARACFELPAPMIDGEELCIEGLDLDATALTAEGRVVGTPGYMAPEQHMGAEVGPAADQYALCVALYESLWGKHPFAVDLRRLLAAKRAGPIEPASLGLVPRWVYAIVARGLSPMPADRFASMAELCAALRTDPSLRRRRRIVAGSAVVATIAAIAFAAGVAAPPGPCADDDAALTGVWDATTRNAVERGFAQSRRPWAAQAWAQAGPQLDAYAGEWMAMRREACEATHVRGEQAPELLDRRMACLEARRRGLAATTELLAAGEDSAIDHTFDLLARLRTIAPCADPIALASAVELPDEQGLRAAVDAQRLEIARARALVDAGRYAESTLRAGTITAAARELDYEPHLAEALAFEGETLMRQGDATLARAALEAALWAALGTGHDEVAVDAASNLVWLAGQLEQSLPEALRWAEVARASLRRGNREDPLELVQLENALGASYQDAARYDEALASFEQALARIADDPALVARAASLRHNIAKQWFDRGDHERARAILEPMISELAAVLGDHHPRVVQSRGSLAQIYGAAGDNARAVELFRQEVEGLGLAMGDDAIAVANARSNLGAALGRMGRREEAIAVTEIALASFERSGYERGAATCLGNLASELYELGLYDAAEARFQRALEVLERIHPDGHPDLVYPLVGLGRVRVAQRRFDAALDSFERGDAFVRASQGPSGHARGLALEGKAIALTGLGRRPEALAVLDEEVGIMRDAGDLDADELPMALRHRAEVLAELGRFDEAVRGLDEALALARTRQLDDVVEQCERERARALEGVERGG